MLSLAALKSIKAPGASHVIDSYRWVPVGLQIRILGLRRSRSSHVLDYVFGELGNASSLSYAPQVISSAMSLGLRPDLNKSLYGYIG